MGAMPEKTIAVKTCANAFEAAFLRDFLENNGIHAWSGGDSMSAWAGRYAMISRGCRVLVCPEDADRARQLLANPPEPEFCEEGDSADADALEEAFSPGDPDTGRCPRCGSENVEEAQPPLLFRFLMNVVFLGLPFFFHKPTWICRDCDWDSTSRR